MMCASVPTPHGTSGWHVKNGGKYLGRDHSAPCHGLWIFMDQPFIRVLGATT